MVELPAMKTSTWGAPKYSDASFDLTGSGKTIDLGDLKANNVPPTIGPLGSFSGKAGSPISFWVGTTQRCEITDYVWKFSDGTTAYGASPQKTFNTAGSTSGQLTVTDASGLTATRNFNINVTA